MSRAATMPTVGDQITTLLTGFTALLSRYSGQEEVVVGTPIANRTPP